MSQLPPLVSIGIPTYNRASWLRRSIESALNQDFSDLELIISDNASTDNTQDVCEGCRARDARVKYVRQQSNKGATANFREVLERASGTFFMWLGDDDWLDTNYVSTCVRHMLNDRSLFLTCGVPRYYRGGEPAGEGDIFCLMQDRWFRRLLSYYCRVTDI